MSTPTNTCIYCPYTIYILYLEFLQLLPHFSTHRRAKLLWDLTEFLLYLFRFLPHFSSRLDDSSYRYIWGIKVPRPLRRFISTEPSATAYLFFLFYISWMWLIGLIIFTLFTIPLEAPQYAGFHLRAWTGFSLLISCVRNQGANVGRWPTKGRVGNRIRKALSPMENFAL